MAPFFPIPRIPVKFAELDDFFVLSASTDAKDEVWGSFQESVINDLFELQGNQQALQFVPFWHDLKLREQYSEKTSTCPIWDVQTSAFKDWRSPRYKLLDLLSQCPWQPITPARCSVSDEVRESLSEYADGLGIELRELTSEVVANGVPGIIFLERGQVADPVVAEMVRSLLPKSKVWRTNIWIVFSRSCRNEPVDADEKLLAELEEFETDPWTEWSAARHRVIQNLRTTRWKLRRIGLRSTRHTVFSLFDGLVMQRSVPVAVLSSIVCASFLFFWVIEALGEPINRLALAEGYVHRGNMDSSQEALEREQISLGPLPDENQMTFFIWQTRTRANVAEFPTNTAQWGNIFISHKNDGGIAVEVSKAVWRELRKLPGVTPFLDVQNVREDSLWRQSIPDALAESGYFASIRAANDLQQDSTPLGKINSEVTLWILEAIRRYRRGSIPGMPISAVVDHLLAARETVADFARAGQLSARKEIVQPLAKFLAGHGVDAWIDEGEMDAGDSTVERLADGTLEVDFVVAVLSKHSIDSTWVRQELSWAMTDEIEGRRLKVIPILKDDLRIPSLLRDKIYADFSKPHRRPNARAQLLRAIVGR